MSTEIHSNSQPWWKTATGYQIYPRSFCDSNSDGIGDLKGIVSKLDHLKDLGIGFVWLSPVYASPMRDNGYDISNYRDIASEFGTLDDFQELIVAAKDRGIRIVMDLVVNHCSDEHEWFRKASASTDCAEHEYFYWRAQNEDGGPPDDQRAEFGGPAWIWVEAVGKYYYGHFGPQQPDLNWQNPELRQEVYDMMNWWLDMGIGGFRMDVIDLIGKDLDARCYAEGPYLHGFIKEMHQNCLAGRDVLTVGETWSARPHTALNYCGADRHELDMVFNFNHVEAAWDPVNGRFGQNCFDLVRHKSILNDWQIALAHDGWNSLYLSNHDLPRPVSTFGDDTTYRKRSAKMLALTMHLMKGTPYVYQGEEIGMTNANFTSLEQFRDIETFGQYREQTEAGVPFDAFLAGANVNGRDNARTPMQWDGSEFAGFSDVTPWIDVNDNAHEINVVMDREDANGVFEFYHRMIQLRKDLPLVTKGSFRLLCPDDPQVFAYLRELDDQQMLVVGNFTSDAAELDAPELSGLSGKVLLSNIEGRMDNLEMPAKLAPYEAFAWLQNPEG